MRAFLLALMAVLALGQQAEAGVFTKAVGFIAKKEVVVVGAGLCLKSQACRGLAERGAVAAGKEALEICEEHPKCAEMLTRIGAEAFDSMVGRVGIDQMVACSENGSCQDGPQVSDYVPPPKRGEPLPGKMQGAKRSDQPKTPIPGVPSKLRARWDMPDGNIAEWDYQHGEFEVYDKRGRPIEVLDGDTGKPKTKSIDKTRRIEP